MATRSSTRKSSSTSSRSHRPGSAERERLASEYWPTALALARRFGRGLGLFGNAVDIEGAANAALAAAIERWEPGRSSFSTWLYRVVRSTVTNQLRAYTKYRPCYKSPPVRTYSLDAILDDDRRWDVEAPPDRDPDQWRAEWKAEELFRLPLTDQQYEVLCLLLLCDGIQTNVADVLGVSITRVCQVVRQIRRLAGSRFRYRPPNEDPRKCTGCGEVKVAEEFYRNINQPGGRSSQCKACQRAYWRTPAGRAAKKRELARRKAIREAEGV